MRSSGPFLVGLTLLAAAGVSTSMGAQARPVAIDSVRRGSGIAGVVRDAWGEPVAQARVSADTTPTPVITDDSGRFVLRGLPPGRAGISITKIGYLPLAFDVTLPVDSVVLLAIRLTSVQTLRSVDVRETRTSESLARIGFTERRQLALGSFLSPEHIDSLAPGVSTPSELLRNVRGIDLRCRGATCVVQPRNAPACLWLFVDGVSHGTEQFDQVGLTPGAIAAIEVYERPSIVPLQFQGSLPQKRGQGFSTASGCGALVVWTKARVR